MAYNAAKQMVKNHPEMAISIVKEPSGWWRSMFGRLQLRIDEWVPQMSREKRRALTEELEVNSGLNWEFALLVAAAAFLAAFGLVMNSASVIIGAMLVAPLMTPIQGAGMSLAQGNAPLFRASLKTVAIGFLCALLSGVLMGSWLRLTSQDYSIYSTEEMWARCGPSLLDLAVGLVGGAAAAYARTRTHLGSALAGAAIAAALVPPITTCGIQLAFYPVPELATHPGKLPVLGPLIVFLANVLTIMIGTSFVLWMRGIRGYHEYGRKNRWSIRMTMLIAVICALFAIMIVQVETQIQ